MVVICKKNDTIFILLRLTDGTGHKYKRTRDCNQNAYRAQLFLVVQIISNTINNTVNYTELEHTPVVG